MNFQILTGNYAAMTDELSNTDWESEFRGKSLNDKWTLLKDKTIFLTLILTLISKLNPLWMTRTAIKAVKKKHRSWKN